MLIGSLFSGIGGLELGLEWAGLGETIWQVEREPFCRAVLAKHWPNAQRFDDVRTVGKATLAPVDLICGGFPCQDVSSAGKGAGLAGERSGLWREFARILRELRPEWVVVENVTSGARKWLDAVVRELEQLGYACLPLPLSASDCGAPHRRARIFIVAHADRSRSAGHEASGHAADTQRGELREQQRRSRWALGAGEAESRRNGEERAASDDVVSRREGSWPSSHERGERLARHAGWSSEPGVLPLVYGLPGGLAGRRRRARIRALGNSVVPQCAEVVGHVILGVA